MNHKKYYLGFSLFPGIGPVLFEKLLQQFGSAKNAWKAQKKDFQKIVGKNLAEKFVAFKNTINLEREMEKCVQLGVEIITLEDKAYPKHLKQIHQPPFLLYVKGDVSILSSPKILGIVGTRKITSYGKYVTEMLTAEVVAEGFVTVSGLALGVDATAHTTTMNSGGKTIAVLGCGVDCCYPRENQKIYDDILATGGVIVSTLPIGMQANVGTFPARNKIIAGLSQGILVTEGAVDSGSLITADFAKKFGKPVFAVPGPITSNLSKGANSLLKNGAIAVTDARDIIAILYSSSEVEKFEKKRSRFTSFTRTIKGDTKEEQKILDLLANSPLHFDEIVRKMEKDSKTVGSLLSLLELKEIIKILPDGSYAL